MKMTQTHRGSRAHNPNLPINNCRVVGGSEGHSANLLVLNAFGVQVEAEDISNAGHLNNMSYWVPKKTPQWDSQPASMDS